MGKLYFNKRIGWTAGLLFATNITSITSANQLLTESLFTFLIILFIIRFSKAITQPTSINIIGTSIIWAVATLCRPLFLLTILPISGFALLMNKKGKSRLINPYFIMVLLCITFIFPWMARNYQITHKWTLSSVSSYNLLATYGTGILAFQSNTREDTVRAELLGKAYQITGHSDISCTKDHTYLPYFNKIGLDIILSHPFTFAYLQLKSIPRCFIPAITEFLEQLGLTTGNRQTLAVWNKHGLLKAIQHYFEGNYTPLLISIPWIIQWIIFLFLFLYGSASMWYLEGVNWVHLFSLFVLILYFVSIPGPTAVARYLDPALPAMCIIGGIGWDSSLNFFKKRRRPSSE